MAAKIKLLGRLRRPLLDDVFGLRTEVNSATYVDRARLDAELSRAVRSGRHVLIYGESLQGKSWLRLHTLPETRVASVQCVRTTTAQAIIEQALGQLRTRQPIAYRRKGVVGLGRRIRTEGEQEEESVSIGQSAEHLSWVADKLRRARRILVVEDFHKLVESEQRSFLDLVKALGELGVPCVIVGTWREEQRLTTLNPELELRLREIRPVWTQEELRAVIAHGCRALRVSIADAIHHDVVASCYGSVGLLQQIMYELAQRQEVSRATWRTRRIAVSDDDLNGALADVAKRMRPRLGGQVELMYSGHSAAGVDATNDELALIIEELIQYRSDEELIRGVGFDPVTDSVCQRSSGRDPSRIRAALGKLEEAQALRAVTPTLILSDTEREVIQISDRRLLFYRRFGSPFWPWHISGSAH